MGKLFMNFVEIREDTICVIDLGGMDAPVACPQLPLRSKICVNFKVW